MANDLVASGYKDLMDTPLAKGAIYAGTIIDRNVESDLISAVSNTSVLSELTKCGQIVEFSKPPRIGGWRPYELNQDMIMDEPTSDKFCLTVCKRAYKSIKIDKETIRRMCDAWDDYEQGFLDDAWTQLSALWHLELLTGMQIAPSHRNVGATAGRHGNINLGTIGAPVHLTKDNLVNFYDRLATIFDINGRMYDGDMFVIVPRAMNTLLLETMFAKQMCCNTQESVLFKGVIASNILGFRVIQSDRLRPTIDPATKRLVYPIIAGWDKAFAFTGDIIDAEIRHAPGNNWGVVYNMMSIYGGGAIYPEALAKAYVTFETEGVAP